MYKLSTFLLFLFAISCNAQNNSSSTLKFTSDLEQFEDLNQFKNSLENVEIIALGENTHGLGAVFNAKTELVKFLHEELGFDMILFESGYGDAALAWEQVDVLSATDYTKVFSSNFYYHSTEIENLVKYVKAQKGELVIQGFDCQPQQNYLIQRMAKIVLPIDSVMAKSALSEMRGFNQLYQFEMNHDTIAFNNQRDRFSNFISSYDAFLKNNQQELLNAGTSENELNALHKSNKILLDSYATIEIGELMGWPISANLRDQQLYTIVNEYKDENPESKIIIWAQNSHIENKPKPNDNVNWMGHQLKKTYGSAYYSVGAIVYSGTNLNYSDSFDFEHNDRAYLAYHLNQYDIEKFVFDLSLYSKDDFTNQLLLGMESNGSRAEFIAKERFDGVLFVKYSDIPTLLK